MYKKTKKLLAWALVVCLVITQMVFANVAMAADRYEGATRYETAAKIAEKGWADGSEYAVLAYGENFPDALCAAPLAKAYDAPILLTDKDALDSSAKAALEELDVETVFIVGGEGVVSQKVEEAVEDMGITVERIFGLDRLETSVAIAEAVEEKLGEVEAVVLAYAENFPDALSISPIAAAKGWPILLTNTYSLSAEVEDFIGDKQVYVVGGSGVISNAAVAGLDYVRLGGDDRFDTNVEIMKEFAEDLNFDTIYLATAYNFPDALAGSALAAQTCSPIVLVGSSLDAGVKNFLKAYASPTTEVVALGGIGVVGSAVVSAVESACDLGELEIESITSINYQLVQVKFNKELDGELKPEDFDFDKGLNVTGVAFGAEHDVVNISTTAQTRGVHYSLSYKGGDWLAVTLLGTVGEYNTKIQIAELDPVALMTSKGEDHNKTDKDYNRGQRTFNVTFDDLDAGYVDIALIPARDFDVDDDGEMVFDDDGYTEIHHYIGRRGGHYLEEIAREYDNDLADAINGAWWLWEDDDDHPVIEYVNGVRVYEGYSGFIDDVPVDEDGLEITVDNWMADYGTYRVVVFVDTNDNDRLELDEDDHPTEMVGVSGIAAWYKGGAKHGEENGTVQTIGWALPELDCFTDNAGTLFKYDDNDILKVDNVKKGMERFESVLCDGDQIEIETYATDKGEESELDINECNGFLKPLEPVANVKNTDKDSIWNDVKLEWTEPDNNSKAAVYDIWRASAIGEGGATMSPDDLEDDGNLEWIKVGSTSDDSFTETDLGRGAYWYKISVTNPVTKEVSSVVLADDLIEIPLKDYDDPWIVYARYLDDGDGEVGEDDKWAILFSEEMDLDNGDFIKVAEQNGNGEYGILKYDDDYCTIENRGGQTMLIVDLEDAIDVRGLELHDGANGDDVLEYDDLEIVSHKGFTDYAGNGIVIPGVAGVDFEADEVGPEVDCLADLGADDEIGETIILRFNEAIDVDSMAFESDEEDEYPVELYLYFGLTDNQYEHKIPSSIKVSTSKTLALDLEGDGDDDADIAKAWTDVRVTIDNGEINVGDHIVVKVKDVLGNESFKEYKIWFHDNVWDIDPFDGVE